MDSRFALSRSEEDKVLAQAKLDALRICEVETAAFSSCAEGRTVSVAWSCRHQFKAMQACMATQMTEKRLDEAKVRFLKEGRVVSSSLPNADGAASGPVRYNNSPYAQ